MNKAEEQYLYQWGRIRAQDELLDFAEAAKNSHKFAFFIKKYCDEQVLMLSSIVNFSNKRIVGRIDYCNMVIEAIALGFITDWPSFVTYMTGETYE